MKIEDSFTVNAPIETVWEYLLNIEEMSKCVPGVSGVEALGGDDYEGQLVVKVGPISAAFSGKVKLTQTEAPHLIAAEVSGDDRASATAVKATFQSTLAEIEGGTQVTYMMDMNLRGRLAQFGSAVINATAKKMTAEFAKNLRNAIES